MGREYGRRRSSWRERVSNEWAATGTEGLLFYLSNFWLDFGWQFDHQDWLLPPPDPYIKRSGIFLAIFWIFTLWGENPQHKSYSIPREPSGLN